MAALKFSWSDRTVMVLPVESIAFSASPGMQVSMLDANATAPYRVWLEDLVRDDTDVVAIVIVQRPSESAEQQGQSAALVMALACPLANESKTASSRERSEKDFSTTASRRKEHDQRLSVYSPSIASDAADLQANTMKLEASHRDSQLSLRVVFDQTEAWALFQQDTLVWRITKPATCRRFPEIRIHLRPAGRWYGTGHLMQQHWPSCTSCLELGPFYPFDNGVCGLGTLAIPGWCTTGGFALLVDERRTPYLHIGLNAPRLDQHAPKKRAWSVGHENALREVLPARDRRFPHRLTKTSTTNTLELGDDLLRIQSRCGYDYEPVWHPLLGTRLGFTDQTVIHLFLGVASEPNVRCARAALLQRMGGEGAPPRVTPPLVMLQKPIWTTWARFKQDVTENSVLAFANEIVRRNLPRSVLEIDDRWSVAYGDFHFDSVKFPHPRSMVKTLHELGFQVTLWCTAFVEEHSEAYQEGRAKGYLVADGTLFPWWQPQPVAALDVTNADACRWFVDRARALMLSTGIDGFKFDSGEPCWLPRQQEAYPALAYPGQYTDWWLHRVVAPLTIPADVEQRSGKQRNFPGTAPGESMGAVASPGAGQALLEPLEISNEHNVTAKDVAEQDKTSGIIRTQARDCPLPSTTEEAESGQMHARSANENAVLVSPAEARAATATGSRPDTRPAQSIPCLYRMFDRFSHDGIDNGLASVIPTMLMSGILGFPFVLPDMVGGNEYDQVRANADLMQRWLYANALMPSIQLSLPPWTYGEAAEHALYEALAIREHLLEESGLLEALASEACCRGAPIARPMWWAHPTLPASWDIDDQFTVGDDLIVAPQLAPTPPATSTSMSESALGFGSVQPIQRQDGMASLEQITQRDANSSTLWKREVWIPPGLWFAYPSGIIRQAKRPFYAPTPIAGPQTITTTNPLPIYLRAEAPLARFVFIDVDQVLARFGLGSPEIP
ncbi:hypothetical protein CCYA_CCYA19G4672 [Cyanidiococcus yangmingshanensis]|nr:hypothetical protein CCYA_CCYA19G4672 [Cyanidiococcus yangmingshanensis]